MSAENTTGLLAKEKTYLIEHQADLAAKHPGKFLLIKGETMWGAFGTREEGVIAGVKKFGSGPFLVRSVSHPEDEEVPSVLALSVEAQIRTSSKILPKEVVSGAKDLALAGLAS